MPGPVLARVNFKSYILLDQHVPETFITVFHCIIDKILEILGEGEHLFSALPTDKIKYALYTLDLLLIIFKNMFI